MNYLYMYKYILNHIDFIHHQHSLIVGNEMYIRVFSWPFNFGTEN